MHVVCIVCVIKLRFCIGVVLTMFSAGAKLDLPHNRLLFSTHKRKKDQLKSSVL